MDLHRWWHRGSACAQCHVSRSALGWRVRTPPHAASWHLLAARPVACARSNRDVHAACARTHSGAAKKAFREGSPTDHEKAFPQGVARGKRWKRFVGEGGLRGARRREGEGTRGGAGRTVARAAVNAHAGLHDGLVGPGNERLRYTCACGHGCPPSGRRSQTGLMEQEALGRKKESKRKEETSSSQKRHSVRSIRVKTSAGVALCVCSETPTGFDLEGR